jgi:hypothetical protein
MRGIWIAVMALAAAACAAGGPASQRDVADVVENERLDPGFVTHLPGQRLAPGQCGVFLFETREPNPFVVFEDEARRLVRIVHAGQIYEIGVSPQGGAFLPGESFRRVYLAADENLTFTLDGVVGELTPSGRRLENVILTARQLDGTRTVRPVAGIRRCRES